MAYVYGGLGRPPGGGRGGGHGGGGHGGGGHRPPRGGGGWYGPGPGWWGGGWIDSSPDVIVVEEGLTPEELEQRRLRRAGLGELPSQAEMRARVFARIPTSAPYIPRPLPGEMRARVFAGFGAGLEFRPIGPTTPPPKPPASTIASTLPQAEMRARILAARLYGKTAPKTMPLPAGPLAVAPRRRLGPMSMQAPAGSGIEHLAIPSPADTAQKQMDASAEAMRQALAQQNQAAIEAAKTSITKAQAAPAPERPDLLPTEKGPTTYGPPDNGYWTGGGGGSAGGGGGGGGDQAPSEAAPDQGTPTPLDQAYMKDPILAQKLLEEQQKAAAPASSAATIGLAVGGAVLLLWLLKAKR